MIGRILRHGAVYAGLNAIGVGVGLLVLPVYARVLPPEAFGAQDLVLMLGSFVTLSVPLEVAQGLARQYAEATNNHERRRLASTALTFTVLAEATAVGGLLVLAPWLSPWLLGPWSDTNWWLVVVAFVAAHGVYTILLSQLRWRLQPVRYAVTVLTQTALIHTVGIVLAVRLAWGFPGLLSGYAMGHAAAAVVAFAASRDDYTFQIDRARLSQMLRFSIPLVPSSLAVILYSYADRFVIRQWLDLEAVGHYAIVVRFAMLVKPMITAAAMAMVPLVVARHNDPRTPADVAGFTRYLWLGVLTCVLCLAAFGPEAMTILVTARYAPDAPLVPLLAGGFAMAELYIVAPGLLIANRTKMIAAINVGSAGVNLILNVLLVPVLGLLGACLGTTLSSALALGLNTSFSQKYYPIPYQWRALGAAGLLTVAIGCLDTWITSQVGAWSAASLLIRGGLTFGALVVIVAVLAGDDPPGRNLVRSLRSRFAA